MKKDNQEKSEKAENATVWEEDEKTNRLNRVRKEAAKTGQDSGFARCCVQRSLSYR